MGADQGVPAAAVDDLNPGEIDLNEGRAAPLARLEHDEAQGASGTAFGFEDGREASLRPVESERNVARGDLIGDHHTGGSPEGEVISETEAGEVMLGSDKLQFGVIEHFGR